MTTDSEVRIARARSGNITTAVALYGISRAELYRLAGLHTGLFKKNASSTIVDFNVLDRIVDELPAAAITPPPPRLVNPFATSPRRRRAP